MTGIAVLEDRLGPVKRIHVREPGAGLEGVLVIDNVALGPAIGGLRMAQDVGAAECMRLARAMTLKNAAAGLAHGGGKSVIKADPRMPADRKQHLIRAFAHALRNETDYIFGHRRNLHGMGEGRDRSLGWTAGRAGGDSA